MWCVSQAALIDTVWCESMGNTKCVSEPNVCLQNQRCWHVKGRHGLKELLGIHYALDFELILITAHSEAFYYCQIVHDSPHLILRPQPKFKTLCTKRSWREDGERGQWCNYIIISFSLSLHIYMKFCSRVPAGPMPPQPVALMRVETMLCEHQPASCTVVGVWSVRHLILA